jgi:hypothetical protein
VPTGADIWQAIYEIAIEGMVGHEYPILAESDARYIAGGVLRWLREQNIVPASDTASVAGK